ncbi:hypothetical protein [Virgibacillus sp. SK37]|uniref:hypothetical protein n=1 Tax=Virgibacillus sp. SK37 TaxID=403957 RepID=UPI0004D18073|nr:hypothetical protein [Virgibacillus sp. SK37]AIF45162.1 hypothetical protein X953_03245 [Virgibacillus sp. SK37]
MQLTTTIFNSKTVFDNNYQIHIIDVEDYSQALLEYINEHFVSICEGDSGSDIDTVKQRARDFFERKSLSTKMGAIAEFFVHLYLKDQGYKQECTYFNLEENSIKKGFDGYYSKDDIEWIMESKSGSIDSNNSKHWNKVKTAYDDLKDKFNGNVTNNPWKNAYNHASQIDVGTEQNIRKNIKMLSDNFTRKNYPLISDFNIIPASTIFLNGQWENQDLDELSDKIVELISEFKYKDIIIICITKKSVEQFLNFINS